MTRKRRPKGRRFFFRANANLESFLHWHQCMGTRTNTAAWVVLAAVLAAAPMGAQSQTDREKMRAQQEVTEAESAVAAAENAGAATLAPALYEEATSRLAIARRDWNSSERDSRQGAALRAVEAAHAAQAAEAQARLVAANNEIRTLRTSISSGGGNPAAVTLYDPPAMLNRGATSMDRVITATNALDAARAAGGQSVAPALIQHADETLKTARRIAKNDRQSESADHLSYVAEMIARRAEFTARANVATRTLPALREQQASLRTATVQTQPIVISTFDRDARLAAERDLETLQLRYEAALREGRLSRDEIDSLRQQVDAQSATLRDLQERERATENRRASEIQALESSLERERSEGRLTAEALAQREEELRTQREELDRLRQQREENERVRLEAEQLRTAAIAEAERLRNEAALQSQASAALREEVEAERARAAETEAALSAAREELARRDAMNQERISAMQAELAKLAETRTSERGFVVTLPGLFFDTGKSVLKPGARNTLAKIADQLRISPDIRIAIEGHTDSVGSDDYNQTLSEKRAAAVRDYLVSRGFPSGRMNTSGLGENAPVAGNETPSGRQQNRRVELIIQQELR
jgi:outer membrane protein OmpA-like peptidoglycan-associated protein